MDSSLVHDVAAWFSTEYQQLPQRVAVELSRRLGTFAGLCRGLPVCGPPCVDAALAAGALSPRLPRADLLIRTGGIVVVPRPASLPEPVVRTLFVLLKRAWLSGVFALDAGTGFFRQDADAAPVRPAVVLCDGYEDMVLPGSDDFGADVAAFTHGRRTGLVPVIVTRSVSALTQAVGGVRSADRVLGQLRSRVFLDASSRMDARLAARRFGLVGGASPGSDSGLPFSELGGSEAVVHLGCPSPDGGDIRVDVVGGRPIQNDALATGSDA